ncbi:M23 family metallopeptidase [Curtobacterium sp. CT11-133]|uniref:M23 family metallopeptidase n=1 Tax=Curtobacterium sp. CT11-133 TaxID=3243014 RepID=UPI0039B0537F
MPFRHPVPAVAVGAVVVLVVSLVVSLLSAGNRWAAGAPLVETGRLVIGPGAVPTVVDRAVPPPLEDSRADLGRATAEAPWVWPTGSRVVGRPWEAPADDYAAGHRGIDVGAPLGTVVVAVNDGTVTFAGQVAGRGVVTIDHGGGLRSTVDSVAPGVATGDTVAQGDAVGTVSVGHCPAADPCLHVGARLDDRYVDPTPYLPAAAWPVLLPESAWTG